MPALIDIPIHRFASLAVVVLCATSTAAFADLISAGSGVVVGDHGEILTANHVIEDCSGIRVQPAGSSQVVATLAWRDERNDIAILRPIDNRGMNTALVFRPNSLRAGDRAIVIGYPLSLPTRDGRYVSRKEPTITVGYVSSLIGMNDNSNELQLNASAQHGNSGGPVVDESGQLIGILVHKFGREENKDDVKDIQYATKAEVARALMDRYGINYYVGEPSEKKLTPADIAGFAKPAIVYIECDVPNSPRASTASAPSYSPLPAPSYSPLPAPTYSPVPAPYTPRPVPTVPACDSVAVTNVLTRLANQRGVYVHNIQIEAATDTFANGYPSGKLCGGYAWTSAGKLGFLYTVTPRPAGQFWVQITYLQRMFR